jgi:hypothetical protein
MLQYLSTARAKMRESLPDILKMRQERIQKKDLPDAQQSNLFWLNVPTIKNPLELRTCRQ